MAPASQKLTFRQKRTEEKMNGRSATNFEAEDSSVEEIASESSEEEEDSSSDEFSDCKGNKERTTEKESTQVSNSSRKASLSEDKENNHEQLLEKAKQEKISVKERTKTFNRMASEVEVTNLLKVANNVSNNHISSSSIRYDFT